MKFWKLPSPSMKLKHKKEELISIRSFRTKFMRWKINNVWLISITFIWNSSIPGIVSSCQETFHSWSVLLFSWTEWLIHNHINSKSSTAFIYQNNSSSTNTFMHNEKLLYDQQCTSASLKNGIKWCELIFNMDMYRFIEYSPFSPY